MKLINENIENVVENVFDTILKFTNNKKSALKTQLMVEEILLGYQDKFGKDTEFDVSLIKRFGHYRIVINVVAPKYNPLNSTDDENNGAVMQSLISAFGNAPFWTYQEGQNSLTYIVKKGKKHSTLGGIALAIGIALLCGMLCRLLPINIQDFLSTKLVSPLFDTFMNMISCIAGPLIYLSVVWGILCIGDVSLVEYIGMKMISRFLLFSFILLLISMLCVLPLFTIVTGSNSQIDFSTLFQLILNIVPNNIITPFSEGNTLQIVFLAVSLGIAVLTLGKKTTVVSQFAEQINFAFQFLMEVLSDMINIFVFMSIFNIILSKTLVNIIGILKLVPIMLIGCLVPMIFYVIKVSIREKISPILLLKKQMPTFLIAISTASSSVAFSENMDCCKKKLGIDEKIVNFGLPLGQIIFPLGTTMAFISIGLCMAELFGVGITPKWILNMFIMAFILGIATPPIPGGAIACFTIFATQLSLPSEAVSMCVAISILTDFVATAVNLFCLQLELVGLSGKLGMLDVDILQQ